jgi:hypothetical protein
MKIMCKKKVYKLCQYYVGETAYIAVRANIQMWDIPGIGWYINYNIVDLYTM